MRVREGVKTGEGRVQGIVAMDHRCYGGRGTKETTPEERNHILSKNEQQCKKILFKFFKRILEFMSTPFLPSPLCHPHFLSKAFTTTDTFHILLFVGTLF